MHFEQLKSTDTVTSFTQDDESELGVWFGDPCYVVPEDQWSFFCDRMFAFEKRNEHLGRHYVAQVTDEAYGLPFYCWSTAWGDGSYQLQLNGDKVASLGVDAGLLGAIPMSLIKRWGTESEAMRLGHVLPSHVCEGKLISDGGDMWFEGSYNNISIPTGYQDGQDDDEHECDEESYA